MFFVNRKLLTLLTMLSPRIKNVSLGFCERKLIFCLLFLLFLLVFLTSLLLLIVLLVLFSIIIGIIINSAIPFIICIIFVYIDNFSNMNMIIVVIVKRTITVWRAIMNINVRRVDIVILNVYHNSYYLYY